ncbi:MAG: FmdB family transcriptional regulator [Chloroflexi bacterium]|nr:FmdB family transcriptional regulator [Chloroflexota bacterium]
MPIYDYRCDHCGHVFSQVQSFHDEALEKCPSCGKKPRRLISTPAIMFKGSGWYSTDTRKKGPSEGSDAPAAPAGDAKAPAKEGAGATTSDAKTSNRESSNGGSSGKSEKPAGGKTSSKDGSTSSKGSSSSKES